MTARPVTVTVGGTFRNERAYPFCPGCGHGPILDALDAALVRRGTDPATVVIVSDIGCSGLSDQYFATSAFHGLHGRSITYASGIKLARPDLDVVVVMGDGGTGIGGAHLLAAARRNIGITVLVMDNFNFGMTGGQHSTTTPAGAVTATTALGNLERPMDLCATVAVNGAAYAYRGTSFDEDLPERMAEAMGCGGFALLDVWELCTAYYVRSNKLNRPGLHRLMDELGFARGVIQRSERPEYAAALKAAAAAEPGRPFGSPPIEPGFSSSLVGTVAVVVAGAAGGKVRSAASLAARAAIASGLWAAQRDDFPVTVKTGHSVSTLVLSRDPIEHAAVAAPDALVVVTPEGLRQVRRELAAMGPGGLVLTVPGLDVATAATVEVVDPAAADMRLAKADLALYLLTVLIRRLDVFPPAALAAAAATGSHRSRPAQVVAAATATG